MKLLILGHAQHGKDVVAELLAEKYNLRLVNASEIVAAVSYKQFGLSSIDEAYATRGSRRPELYDLIASWPETALADFIFSVADVYVGCRRQEELDAVIEKHNPTVLWVDASQRKPLEPGTSISIKMPADCWVIDNNGTLEDLCSVINGSVDLLDWR